MPGRLQTILGAIAQQVTEEFDFAKWIEHSGESGRAREAMVRNFLTRVVPSDFGIDTGFVLDGSDNISKQIDIVIHRKSRAPVLEIGGVKHFMVENVAAVIEVKATIAQKGVLISALDNLASVKCLDRTGGGLNTAAGFGVSVRADHFQGQVFGAIIAGRSMEPRSTVEAILDWMHQHPRGEWPNMYVDLGSHLIEYTITNEAGNLQTSTDPMIATGIAPIDTALHGETPIPPLAQFAVRLLELLSITPEIDYTKAGYFVRDTRSRDFGYGFDDDEFGPPTKY